MTFLRAIDIGEVQDLSTLAEKLSIEPVPGVYRPPEPFLLKLADLYLELQAKSTLLH